MALPRAEAFALDRRPGSRAKKPDSEPAAARGEAAGRAIRLGWVFAGPSDAVKKKHVKMVISLRG